MTSDSYDVAVAGGGSAGVAAAVAAARSGARTAAVQPTNWFGMDWRIEFTINDGRSALRLAAKAFVDCVKLETAFMCWCIARPSG